MDRKFTVRSQRGTQVQVQVQTDKLKQKSSSIIIKNKSQGSANKHQTNKVNGQEATTDSKPPELVSKQRCVRESGLFIEA